MATIRLLERDPELGQRVPPESVPGARRKLVAPLRDLAPGPWSMPADAMGPGHLGFLILDGLMTRDVLLAGTSSTELLGAGDLVQPLPPERDDGLLRCHVAWRALSPVRMADLDRGFAQALTGYPEVVAALLERARGLAFRMGVHEALLSLSPVETRLLVLFWHLAERWGRVTRPGIVLPLALTHQMLGQLVGSRRASVTTALKELDVSGLVLRRGDGTWLLTGEPPDELAYLTWHRTPPRGRDAGKLRIASARGPG